jgi:hypothetical protein
MFGNFYEMMDQMVCEFYKISIEQLNHLTEKSTEEELLEFIQGATQEDILDHLGPDDDLFSLPKEVRVLVFSRIRRGIEIRDKHLKLNGVWILV